MQDNRFEIIVASIIVMTALLALQSNIGRKLDRISDQIGHSGLYTPVASQYGKIEATHPIYRIPAEDREQIISGSQSWEVK